MSKDGTYREGDTVILEDTHHAHNKGLKACEGRKGEILAEPSGYNDKCLVEFEGKTRKLNGRYWVAPKWLKQQPITDPDSSLHQELCWALDRIALHGESADPQVRWQAKTQATDSLEKITDSIRGQSDRHVQ